MFLSEARDELLEAVAYYDGEASGLGSRLWEEVDRHIAWIERNYEVPRSRPGGYRRINLKLFRTTSRTSSENLSSGYLPSRTAIGGRGIGSIGRKRFGDPKPPSP